MKNIKFKEKSLAEIEDFINEEIPFDELEKNGGIYETNVIAKDLFGDNITIGVAYEDVEGNEGLGEWYYYNIFAGQEYIDLGKNYAGFTNNKTPTSALIAIKNKICELIE